MILQQRFNKVISFKKEKVLFSKPPTIFVEGLSFPWLLEDPKQSWLCHIPVRFCKLFFPLIKHLLTVLCSGAYLYICTCLFIRKHTLLWGHIHAYLTWTFYESQLVHQLCCYNFFQQQKTVSDSAMERQLEKETGQRCRGEKWMQTVSHRFASSSIWSKLGVHGEVLSVSQWSQIAFAQEISLQPSERNISVCCNQWHS